MDAASETVVKVEGAGGTNTPAKPATTSAARVAPNITKSIAVAGGTTPGKPAVATKPTAAAGTRPAGATKPAGAVATKPAGTVATKPAGTVATRPTGAVATKPTGVAANKTATVAATKPATPTPIKPEVTEAPKSVSTAASKPEAAEATKPAVATDTKPAVATDTKPAATKPAVAATATKPTPTAAKMKPQGTAPVKKSEEKPSGGATNGQSRSSRRLNNKQRRKAFDAYGRICQIPVKSRTEKERESFEWAKKIVKEALGGDMSKYKLSQYTQKHKSVPSASGTSASTGIGRTVGLPQGSNNKRKSAAGQSQGSKLPLKKNRYDAAPRGYMGGNDAQYGTEIVKQLLTTLITSSGAFNDNSYNNSGGGMNDMNNGNYNYGPSGNGLYDSGPSGNGPSGNGPYNYGPSGNGPYNNYGSNGSYGGGRSDMNSNNANFNNMPPQFNNANTSNSSFNSGFSNTPQSYPSNSRQNTNFSSFSNSQPTNNSYNTNNRSAMGSNMNPTSSRSGPSGALTTGPGIGAGAGVGSLGSSNSKNQLVLAIIDRSDKNYCISPAKWKAVEVKLNNVFLNVLREYPGAPPVCRDGGWHQGRIKLIICADQRSAILYRMAVSRLGELWRNAKLEAVPWNEDNDRPKVHCFLPSQPRDPTSILQIIKTSNPNLSTGNWRIEKLEEPKGDSQFAIILIDHKSLEPLDKCNFLINYGFSSIKLKLNRKYEQQRSAGNMNTSNAYNEDVMNNFNSSKNSQSTMSDRQYDQRNSYTRGAGQNYAY